MVATRSKTSSDSKRGNFEEDDVQMLLELVKELLKQQELTLKVFHSAYMDSDNTRIDNLMKDVLSCTYINDALPIAFTQFFQTGNQIHQYSTRYSDFYRPHTCRTNIK